MTYSPPPGSIPTLGIPTMEGIGRVHLIGIGGAGMSGIARLLLARGISVTGSDLKASKHLDELRAEGAKIFVGHRPEQIGDPDAVVVSTAIPERNPELMEANRRGTPVLARIQLLAALARGMKTFGISGTHGKTTTTSMLAVVLERTGSDPTYVIGGDLNEAGSGARHGEGSIFVAEADESDGSFLLLAPDVAVVTNVEEDHLDFYRGGKEEIRTAFAEFLARAAEAVVCGDDEGARAAMEASGCNAITYGIGSGNAAVLRVGEASDGGARGTLELDGEAVELSLVVPGVHNLLNACAAMLAARFAGIEAGAAAVCLRDFGGVRRRFEYRGSARGVDFYDDYAHHPTEITATLRAARTRDHRRLVAVFQPHRYTRTQAMWRALGEALAAADVTVVTDVYGAGEDPIPGVTGKLAVDALAEASPGKKLVYLPHRSDVARFLASDVHPGDLVLTLGAGDITMVAEETLNRMRQLG